ncbi:MAG: cytidine deaminase [Candidatus Riflebacteria bacterium]|nr:cytidine deaminase [Candidatus Riflebacteria bacterium]
MTDNELIQQAIEASKKAYAPYSNFHVGAAVLTSSGKVFQGCNVENSSYGLCNCAERTALFSAVAAGEREFKKLFVYVDREEFTSPCGACRQVMIELAPDMEVYLVNNKKQTKKTTSRELMPWAFSAEDLA